MEIQAFENMVGIEMVSVTGAKGDGEMRFVASDGRAFVFYHDQDCCESVFVEDVCGDLADLVGSPLLTAEEVSEPEPYAGSDSYTWTFYRFATAKGTVTVRWLGESNGCYSERVDFKVEPESDA